MTKMTYNNLQLNLAPNGSWVLSYGCTVLGYFIHKAEAISAFNKRKWQLRGE
nr:MAG TPA: hypothetical protein [Caudoviricetes sp.]